MHHTPEQLRRFGSAIDALCTPLLLIAIAASIAVDDVEVISTLVGSAFGSD